MPSQEVTQPKYESRYGWGGEVREEKDMKERKEFGARMGLASQCNAHKEVCICCFVFRGMWNIALFICKKFCKKKSNFAKL